MKATALRLSLALVAGSFSAPAFAHGGGLDANGCHTEKKTGIYHCHRGPAAGQAPRTAANFAGSNNAPRVRASGSFANCSEARAAGAAPVRRGDPGYAKHLDRDGDGVGCE